MPKTVIKYSPSLLPPMPRLRPRVLNIFQMENWKTDSAVTWQQSASVRTTDNAQEPGFGIKPFPKSGCKLCLGNLFSCVGAYHYLRPWMLRSCHHIYFEPNVITAYVLSKDLMSLLAQCSFKCNVVSTKCAVGDFFA